MMAYQNSNIAKSVLVIAALLVISACQTGGGQGPGSPIPSPSPAPGDQSKVPGIPSPSGGMPSPGTPSPNMPSPSLPSPGGSPSDGAPEGWETDEGLSSEGGGGSGDPGEPSFEESEGGSEGGAFESPEFEDAGGLSQEELDELERELNESLGDFDEDMQREQTYAEERANDNSESLGGIGQFDQYEGETYKQGGQPSGSGQGQGRGKAQKSDKPPSKVAKGDEGGEGNPSKNPQEVAYEGEDNAETADQIEGGPVGRDDDIVARQIREAAENETDPVLRERLWEEYRKYKDQ